MQINVTELDKCKLSVHYEADALEVLNKKAVILDAFKKAPIPGFRPGKATPEAIYMHYKNQVDDSLKRALSEDAFHNALFEKKIKPHGAPRFNDILLKGGKFSCKFELYTKPDFELGQYEGLKIPKPHNSISVSELQQKMLQDLRVRYGDISPFTESDFVQMGDNVIINYDSFIDGEKIDALCAEGEMLTIGASKLSFIDDNILGMSVGDTREFDFVVPDGSLPSLVGKTVHFKVTLNTGSKTTPCPLDNTLAEKLNMKDIEEVNLFVNSAAVGKIANAEKTMMNEAVANKLVNDTSIEVPNWMTLSEAQYLAYQAQLNWEVMLDEDKNKYMEMSEKNVKLSLILDKIREVEPSSQLSDDEVFNIVKQNLLKSKTEASLDSVIAEMNRTGYLQILFSRIKDEYTLDYVVKKAEIIE